MLNHALQYAASGLAVFPCISRDKRPATKNGCLDATTDPDMIRRWWTANPRANVAISATGLCIVDVDSPTEWDQFCFGHDLPDTLKQFTSRGFQLFFRQNGTEIRNSASKLAPDIDIRGNGGYVIAPPSVHPSGRIYHWDGDFDASRIAVVPSWIVQKIEAIRAEQKQYTPSSTPIDTIPQGQRDDTLFRRGCAMRRAGFDETAILAALQSLNVSACSPPLSLSDIKHISKSASKYDPAPISTTTHQTAPEPTPTPIKSGVDDTGQYHLTEAGLAERFVLQHASTCKYDHAANKWMIWDGCRWAPDCDGEATRRILESARYVLEMASEVDDLSDIKRAASLFSASKIRGALALASNHKDIARTTSAFDTDVDLLNLQNGTLNTRTGDFYQHNPGNMITKICHCEYNPNATCTRFDSFLRDIFPGDESLIHYVQVALSTGISGRNIQAFFAAIGEGANGKSVLVNVIFSILGDYVHRCPSDTFAMQRDRAPRNDIADLRGVRLLIASELPEGMRLDENTIKDLTGGELISARHLFQESFTFRPQCTVWLSGNHKPVVRGQDEGFWRRCKIVPFSVTIPEEKRKPFDQLCAELTEEAPGIMAWLVRGYHEYVNASDTLPACEAVRGATGTYKTDSDQVARWVNESCEIAANATVSGTEAYNDFSRYTTESGEHPVKRRKFYDHLRRLNVVESIRDNSINFGLILFNKPTIKQTAMSWDD